MSTNSPLTNIGNVVGLYLCPGHGSSMLSVQAASAITGKGLEGDIHARYGSNRQVLIVDKETLDSLELESGIIKENITTTGIETHLLIDGQKIFIGNDVILEITGPCKPCQRMDDIKQGLQETLSGRRGALATVHAGGTIAIGDPIHLTN